MQHKSARKVVVVLGAAGFVGRHACRVMHVHGHSVVGVGHSDWSLEEAAHWGIERWIRSDIDLAVLRELKLDQPVAAVLHCAGSGAVSYSYLAPWDDFQRATVTTAAALEWIRGHGAERPRLVLVSSAAVYGDQGDVDCAETSIRAPISPYGYHKLSAEMLCDSYSRFFDVKVSIVRLFSVYGEGLRKQLLWDALGKFSRGDARFFGTGHELRDWVHVDDAARLLVAAALEEQEPFAIYNGGSVHATTRDILQRLADTSGFGQAPTFSGETHVGNPRRLTASSSHSRRQLGWTPTVTLAEGLDRYARWYRQTVDGEFAASRGAFGATKAPR